MSQRKTLTLEEKISLINDNQNGNGLSTRQLTNKYQKVVLLTFFFEVKSFWLIILQT